MAIQWFYQTRGRPERTTPAPAAKSTGRKKPKPKTAAQAKAEEARKEIGEAVDRLRKVSRGSQPGALGLNKDMIVAVLDLMKATIKLGRYEFQAFVERVVEQYGRQFPIDNAQDLRTMWDNIRKRLPNLPMGDPGDVAEMLAEKPAEAAPATRGGLFDLNIETFLEHWGVEHGVREIIANALDECRLSSTPPIDISKDQWGRWHIRDYGRGIQIEHFTQNENAEKSGADGVIGKFGVGLKDALATLYRHQVKVSIRSSHGSFTLTKASKHDFDAVKTLHILHEPGDPAARGTDFILTGVSDDAIEKAKSMFLRFREHRVLDATPYGQVIEAPPTRAHVFINGVWVNA